MSDYVLTEEPLQFGEGGRLFGILTLPGVPHRDARELPVFVFLSAGLLHRVGPHRLYVRLARELGQMGFYSLRVDLAGIGDSLPRSGLMYQQSVAADYAEILGVLDSRLGSVPIVLVGLCSGGDNAIRLTPKDARIVGLLLLDPVCSPDVGFRKRAFVMKYMTNTVRYVAWLKSLPKKMITSLRGSEERVNPLTLRDPPTPEHLRSAFECIRERKGRALSVFTEYALEYYNQAGQLGRVLGVDSYHQFCTEVFWPQAEHTYTLELYRRRLIELVKTWAGGYLSDQRARLGPEAALSGLTTLSTLQGFRVSEVAAGVRKAWEAAAVDRGLPLALSDLELWHAMGFGPDSTLCAIQDGQEKLVGGFAVHRWPSRALPGHCILRLECLGESIPEGTEPATVDAVLSLARRTPRVLRVVAELHDRDAARRARIAGALRAAGFYQKDQVRMYERTLAINLQHGDEALLGSFSARARQELRRAKRFPLSVITIEDNALVPQIEQIHRETYSRTGGQAPAHPWTRLVAAAREAPDRLRIFGVMLADEGTARLVAFALALRYGTFAVYHAAGSTRLADRRIPLAYPAIWALMRWARDTGAIWLDFGGVSPGSSGSEDDPVGGISEFKRKFGGEELVVGEDWQFDVAPLRQRLVQMVIRVLTFLRPVG